MSRDRPNQMPIDVNRHLAARRAMGELRGRQRVVVTGESFGAHGHSARVLVDGEYYEVDDIDLKRLRAGSSPQDLELYPVPEIDR